MRIALNSLAASGSLSGMATYARNLITALAKVDERNEYILHVSRDEAPRYSGLGANFQLVPTVASRPLRILWEQTGLPAELKRRKIDVFHGLAFVAPLVKTCRQVVTVHDMTFFLFPRRHVLMKRHYFRSVIPRCVRRADQVIAVSESTKKDMVRILGADAEKIKVAYHGKDERFRPGKQAANPSPLLAKYGLSKKVVLFVGLVEPSDARGLARAIGQVLTDRALRERMAREGIERSRLFTWERTARQTLTAYESAAAQLMSVSKVD